MATIKSYTDLEQSKKLAEILPLESADMFWRYNHNIHTYDDIPKILAENNWGDDYNKNIPCWSLAALLDIVKTYFSRSEITLRADKKYNVFAVKSDFVFRSFDEFPDGIDNLVDACVVMIEKLHELKIL